MVVQGNLTLQSTSTLVVQAGGGNLTVEGCVVLEGGKLQVNFTQKPANGEQVVILHSNSNCITGNLSSIQALLLYPGSQCDRDTLTTAPSQNGDLTVLVQVTSSCTRKSNQTVFIIVGCVVGGSVLIGTGIVVLLILRHSRRKKSQQRTKMRQRNLA